MSLPTRFQALRRDVSHGHPGRDMVRRGLIVGLPAAGMGLVLQAALSILLARSLSTGEFGLVGVLMGTVALMSPLWGHLKHQTARASSGHIAYAVLGYSLPWGLVLGALVGVAALVFPIAEYRAPLGAMALLVASEPAASALSGMATRVGGVAHGLGLATRASIALPLVAVTAWLSTLTAIRVMLIYALAGMLFAASLYLIQSRHRRRPTETRGVLSTLRNALGVGLPLAWASLAMMATHRLDLVMLGSLKGTVTAGSYQTALVMTAVPLALYAAALSRYLPSLQTVGEGRPLQRHYSSATASASVLVLPMVVGVGVWGDVLTGVVFGARYRMEVVVYVLLAIAMVIHMLAGPNGVTMVGLRNDRQLARVATLQLITNVGLNLLLIPVYGAVGATVATLLAYVVFNAAMARSLRKAMGGRWAPWSWLRPCFGLLVTCTAVAVATRSLLGETLAGLITASIMLMALWLVALIWLYRSTETDPMGAQ